MNKKDQITPSPTTETAVSTEIHEREKNMRELAHQICRYSLQIEKKDIVWIRFDSTGSELAQVVVAVAEEYGAKCILSHYDMELDALLFESLTNKRYQFPQTTVTNALTNALLGKAVTKHQEVREENGKDYQQISKEVTFLLQGPLADYAHFLAQATKVLTLANRKNIDRTEFEYDETIERAFTLLRRPLQDIVTKDRSWCLIRPPTPQDAEQSGITFAEYEALFFKACSRPWEKVEAAQAVLVEKLKHAKRLQVIVPPPPQMDQKWTTSIEMEIEGKIAANSVARRNMPGSEVFLSPNAGTLQGTYALPYKIMLKNRIVPNLILYFENGKVVNFYTDGTKEDKSHIQNILNTDDGASYIGELGIGTNPVIDFPVLNTLLNEKTFGVHLALGKAYDYTEYLGQKVNVDNGVRSSVHLDLARVMTPKYGGGQILLDGEPIFDNGRFLGEQLAVLNG